MLLIRRPKNPTLLPKKIAVNFENIMAIYQRHWCGDIFENGSLRMLSKKVSIITPDSMMVRVSG